MKSAHNISDGISYDTTNTGWRVALSITFIPATILLCVLPWIPESRTSSPPCSVSMRFQADRAARWLYEKGREEECRRVLRKLHGGSLGEGGELVLSEAGEIEFEAMRAGSSCILCRLDHAVRADTEVAITWDQKHGQDKWAALWNTKAARYRSFVAFTSQSWWGKCYLFTTREELTICQHVAWNGQSIFAYYYTIVFRNAGITNTHIQFGIAAIQNASWCVGGILGGYLLDQWGRRTSYLIGTGQAAVMLIIQGPSLSLSLSLSPFRVGLHG